MTKDEHLRAIVDKMTPLIKEGYSPERALNTAVAACRLELRKKAEAFELSLDDAAEEVRRLHG